MAYNPDYYRENFRDKFLSALDYRYSDIPQHKRRGKFVSDYYDRNYTDIKSSMNSWLSGKIRKVPKLDVLISICNLLDCDVDYFLTKQKSLHKEVGAVADIIHLPEKELEDIAFDPAPLQYFLKQCSYEDFRIMVNSYVFRSYNHIQYYSEVIEAERDDEDDFLTSINSNEDFLKTTSGITDGNSSSHNDLFEDLSSVDDELSKWEKYDLPSLSDPGWKQYQLQASAMLAVIRDDMSRKLSEILLSIYDPGSPQDVDYDVFRFFGIDVTNDEESIG